LTDRPGTDSLESIPEYGPQSACCGLPPRAIAVVVGASRGIGLAIARALGHSGLRVVLASRAGPDLARAASDLNSEGVDAEWLVADAARPDDAAELSATVARLYGVVPTVLVYAAGIFGPIGDVVTTPVDEWRSVIDTNLLGAFYVTRFFLPNMIAAGWGRIIYVSSKAALGAPGGGASAYAISKIGLNRLTCEVAAEVTGKGITANSIHPGEVKTAMWSDIGDRAHRAGEIGESLRGWAKEVDRTGGDPETLAAEMVRWLVEHPELNGTFLLPEEWYILRQRGEP
jgi:NAD(P)-dependent dehydrogenase (short-subunit alcohol dehydrogenase family)